MSEKRITAANAAKMEAFMAEASPPAPSHNCLSYWYPKLRATGVRAPDTRIVTTDAVLLDLLDGKDPEGWEPFMADLGRAVDEIGLPCFLRTGHGSGKHEWADTCYVTDRRLLERHVSMLVNWSALVDFMGLPTNVWAVRELIPTHTLFYAFDGFPVTREFRVFIRDDEIEHVQPYWPPDSILQPSAQDWRAILAEASKLDGDDNSEIGLLAGMATSAVGGGYWSVDCLQDRDGEWWVTDMADGDRSFRWLPSGADGRTG